MPSAMIHLLTAKKFSKDADVLFFIGNVAPDCIKGREAKDITHFRDLALKDRDYALEKLKKDTDRKDPFQLGILLHLFLDRKWDESAIKDYKRNFTGNDFFLPYRREIHNISSYLYHHEDWAKQLWRDMIEVPREKYGTSNIFSADGIRDYLEYNYIWHNENNLPFSEYFSRDYVDKFTDEGAREFSLWLNA